jgi:hypothetical protein
MTPGQKPVFRNSHAVRSVGRTGLDRPCLSRQPAVDARQVVAGTGKTAIPGNLRHRRSRRKADFGGSCKAGPDDFGLALARINRHIIRTTGFLALLRSRSRGCTADPARNANLCHTHAMLREHDRTVAESRSIPPGEVKIAGAMARLGQSPAQKMSVKALVIPPHGSGGSTLFAPKPGKTIISDESDKAWADALSARLAEGDDTAKVPHVSISPTEKCGFPTRPGYPLRYRRYPLSVRVRADLGEPDLLLVDGRFRAARLAALCGRARRPTTVPFGDCEDRPHHAWVEGLAQKAAAKAPVARIFVIPVPIPPEMLTDVVGWFSDPR